MKYLPLLGTGGLFAALFLTGCGSDRPVYGPPAEYHAEARTLPQAVPASPASGADPLLGSADPSAADPLLSGGLSAADPLHRSDSLHSGDPMQARAMPTDHSHWLRGSIGDARLTVLLNGVRYGAYSGLVDQDITMRLRRGVNSVTFVCEPRQGNADVEMYVVESEHNPPIPPLVTFQSRPLVSDTALKTTTRTFTFFAK